MKRAPMTVLVALVALSTLGSVVPSPAQAHADLISAYPSSGTTLVTSPDEITLTFADPLSEPNAEITVTDQTGTDVTVNSIETDGTSVTRHLVDDPPPGTYTVTWAVTAADGHRENGKHAYVVDPESASTAAPVTATASPTDDDAPPENRTADTATPENADDALTIWILYAFAAALILAAIVGVIMGFRASHHRTHRRR